MLSNWFQTPKGRTPNASFSHMYLSGKYLGVFKNQLKKPEFKSVYVKQMVQTSREWREDAVLLLLE